MSIVEQIKSLRARQDYADTVWYRVILSFLVITFGSFLILTIQALFKYHPSLWLLAIMLSAGLASMIAMEFDLKRMTKDAIEFRKALDNYED